MPTFQGKLSGMTVREFYGVHSAPVRQVSYYASLSCIISCSDCSIPLSMYSMTSSNSSNVFHTTKANNHLGQAHTGVSLFQNP